MALQTPHQNPALQVAFPLLKGVALRSQRGAGSEDNWLAKTARIKERAKKEAGVSSTTFGTTKTTKIIRGQFM